MRHVAVFLMFFCVIGCTPFGGFKPPPMWWERFLGGDANEAQIKVAMLECGSNLPGESIEFPSPDGKGFLLPQQGINQIILISRCMQDAGFPFRDTGTCQRWNDLPACKYDAVIPKRSVENRLNSRFCQIVPKAKICHPEYNQSKDDPSTRVNQIKSQYLLQPR